MIGEEYMRLRISAKCSDMFCANLLDRGGKRVGVDYDGYVPGWFPNNNIVHIMGTI